MTVMSDYTPSEANRNARRWFQDARFGMFVHWGVYSVLSRGEWVQHWDDLGPDAYRRLPPEFGAENYDPAAWVALARRAGMRYMAVTSKHHDGFAMWHSQVSDWNVVKQTRCGEDVLARLAAECERQSMPLMFYYSLSDWHHPDYCPPGWSGPTSERPRNGRFELYLDFLRAQLTELLDGSYGPVAGIWFDGWWDQQLKYFGQDTGQPTDTRVDWKLTEIYDLVHRLQPACLIGNNHHVEPFPGEDFQMFEKDLPGKNTAGFSSDAVIGRLPLETCETINESWGYHAMDRDFKSTRALIRYLVRASGHDSNLLLNVGPSSSGEIQAECTKRLESVGKWLENYGESIHATRAGPVAPQIWGATTQRGQQIFVHILHPPPTRSLVLTGLGDTRVVRASVLGQDQTVPFQQDARIVLDLRAVKWDITDTIVTLDTPV